MPYSGCQAWDFPPLAWVAGSVSLPVAEDFQLPAWPLGWFCKTAGHETACLWQAGWNCQTLNLGMPAWTGAWQKDGRRACLLAGRRRAEPARPDLFFLG